MEIKTRGREKAVNILEEKGIFNSYLFNNKTTVFATSDPLPTEIEHSGNPSVVFEINDETPLKTDKYIDLIIKYGYIKDDQLIAFILYSLLNTYRIFSDKPELLEDRLWLSVTLSVDKVLLGFKVYVDEARPICTYYAYLQPTQKH